MSRDSNLVTNLLLGVVIVLLLVGLAIPTPREEPAAPLSPPSPPAWEAELADLMAKVDLLVRTRPVAATAPVAPASEDEIVVRIPGKLARELGITAADVRVVVEGLARLTKEAGRQRPRSNETAAIAVSRNCCSAQAQFQATAKADLDRDGTGEFGSFRELSGDEAIRGDPQRGKLNPPVLSGAFRNPSSKGFVSRSGYYFVIYLPSASGYGVIADSVGYGAVDPELAETTWCMYAWPVNHEAGTRTFMVNQTGDVVATDAEEYVGESAPRPGAAYKDGGIDSIGGLTAIGTQGQDGHLWKQVN